MLLCILAESLYVTDISYMNAVCCKMVDCNPINNKNACDHASQELPHWVSPYLNNLYMFEPYNKQEKEQERKWWGWKEEKHKKIKEVNVNNEVKR